MKLSVVSLGSNYRAPHYLEFAVSDAVAVSGGFKTQTFYDTVDSVLIDPSLNASAIERKLTDVASRCRSVDCLIFFFAGHGLIEEDASGSERLYLTCDATDMEDIEKTALSLDVVLGILEETSANVAVSLLDCCFSGYGGRSILGPNALKRLQTGRAVNVPALVKPGYGRIVLAAAGRDEKALECPDREHGLFTASLLESLTTQDPLRKSISVIALYSTMQSQVLTMSGGQQCPSLYGGEHRVNLPTIR